MFPKKNRIGRRHLLAAGAALPTLFATARAQPAASRITPELLVAARQEGNVSHYTSDDLALATKLAKAFEEKYPGIKMQLERTGSERVYQRVSQEYASNIHQADVVTSADLGFIVAWKQQGMLTQYVPEETASWSADARDKDGFYTLENFTLVVMGYNTRLLKPADAPKTWTDLLDPKWRGKMVKGHPGYSGTIMNGTYALSNLLGWEYFEKLAKQNIMQVQSAGDPPLRAAQGERALMADAAESVVFRVQQQGAPLAIIYPTEGVPVVPIGVAIMKTPKNPNAARLLIHFLTSREGQQIITDTGGRSFHPQVKPQAHWEPLAAMKLIFNDPAALARDAESVKKRYTQIFGT
jgi:iron(III) transport system substrate-binding protein